MIINITYDSTVANAPAGFKSAVAAAVDFYQKAFSSPLTINIQVSWGAINGAAIDAGALGESMAADYYALTYNEMRDALWRDARTNDSLAAARALSASDPTNGGMFVVSSAEAKALGLIDPKSAALDGYIGLDATAQYAFDPQNRGVTGQYDAIGVIEHEIGHILGRIAFLGKTDSDGEKLYSPLDLFRFTAAGTLAPAISTAAWFGLSGANLLMPFNDPSNEGSNSDWSDAKLGDVFCAFGDDGTQETFSAVDYSLMDVLGYHAKPVMPAAPLANPPPTSFMEADGIDATIAQGQAFHSAWMSSPTSGVKLTLTNNGTLFNGAEAVRMQWLGQDFQATFVNAATGIVAVRQTSEYYDANGIIDPSGMLTKVINAGLIQAVCSAETELNPLAYGVRCYRNPNVQITNQASGTIKAWSYGTAFGVLFGWGGSVDNAGVIDVTGSGHETAVGAHARAAGIYGANRVTNSGLIRVTSLSSDASIGVLLAQDAGIVGQYVVPSLTNSGTIIADLAIEVGGLEAGPFNNWVAGTITNTGTIIGDVDLWYGKERVFNTGIIAGNIYFGDLDAYYDGSGGHLYGDIVLGLGVNTVLLGNGGETVRGGGTTDIITGGAGDDTITGGAGDDILTGGAGNDTAKFSGNRSAYTVTANANGSYTVTGLDGSDTLTNIEMLQFADQSVTPANAATSSPPSGGQTISGTGGADTLTGGADNDTINGGAGNDIISGGAGADTLNGGDDEDTITGGTGNDAMDGGSSVDTAVFSGSRSAYTITQTSTGKFTVTGPDGVDTLSNIEYAKFGDQTVRLLPGSGTTVNWSDPSTYMGAIRDFDGNDLGGTASWKLIGTADVNGDGRAEHILFNRQIGRWAEVGSEADGLTYFSNNGWAGTTRVVGIYIDPLVANGTVVKGSDTDSQRRFQNDLNIENINGILGQATDYNHDGLQEVYFSLTDGTAYLHAYMHADGNIQYANYQNKQQVIDYLTTNGFASSTWAGWFPSGQSVMAAVAG